MRLFDTINEEIKKAMLAKEKVRLDTLRSVKKEFLEAITAKGASHELSDEAAITILQRMAKQRKESADIFKQQNREDLATEELEQLTVLQSFLPEQLSEEQLEEEIKIIINETGAASMKDMGKVMGIASKKLNGKAEGKAISEMVKKLLNQ